MAFSAGEIYRRLAEWPHRGAGSEEEMEARESLMALLTGVYGVTVTEEGFLAPRTYLPFFGLIAVGSATAVLMAPMAPLLVLMAGLVFLGSHVLFFDWRVSPLIWLGARETCANLVASKGAGRRLIILMAHLDSAPASFAYRPDQVRHFGLSVYAGTAIVGFGVMIPALELSGFAIPLAVRAIAALFILGQFLMAGLDFWRFGYTQGGNDNLTGVAAATALASSLWDRMPDDAEVRLVITSAEEAGMLGAQHYWQQHREDLKARDTHILNIDTVGAGKLAYVNESGGFTRVYYDGPLARAAHALKRFNARFKDIGPARHHVGDFDSVWFVRDGLSALTIAAYDSDGLMPHIHTMEDTTDKVDIALVEEAAAYGEAIIRMLPQAVKA